MSKPMLLVMDMINDLVHPEGPNAKTFAAECRRRGVIEAIAAAQAKARAAGVPVGYVRVGFSPDYRECPPASPIFSRAREHGLFKLGAWGTEVYAPLAPVAGEFDIVKHRVSPFYGTPLEPMLRAQGVARLVLCGVSTNGVVQAAVREGHDRDYAITLIEDGCCGSTPEEHEHAMAGLARFCLVTTGREVAF